MDAPNQRGRKKAHGALDMSAVSMDSQLEPRVGHCLDDDRLTAARPSKRRQDVGKVGDVGELLSTQP